MYSAKIICDSVSETGKRLTTFEITFPRIVLAEAKTHRVFRGFAGNVEEELWIANLGINDDENLSRNSASSRAIPLKKQIERIMSDPFIPERFPLNCSGMQPQEYVDASDYRYEDMKRRWLEKRDYLIKQAMEEAEVFNWHKQLISRPLEVFMWHTAVISATEYDNFFKLRTNEQAQYEIRRIADLMYEAYHFLDGTEYTTDASRWENNERVVSAVKPRELKVGEWHLPFVSDEDYSLIDKQWKYAEPNTILQILKRISVARCARVSYLTHDGKRDIEKDLELFERLRTSRHWSPFEHVCTPHFEIINEASNHERQQELLGLELNGEVGWDENRTWFNKRSGNMIGWKQYRKEFQDENCTYFRKES